MSSACSAYGKNRPKTILYRYVLRQFLSAFSSGVSSFSFLSVVLVVRARVRGVDALLGRDEEPACECNSMVCSRFCWWSRYFRRAYLYAVYIFFLSCPVLSSSCLVVFKKKKKILSYSLFGNIMFAFVLRMFGLVAKRDRIKSRVNQIESSTKCKCK